MQLVDNYGLFIYTWPQIITDWCLADGLDLLQIPHMLHLIPKQAGTKYTVWSFWQKNGEPPISCVTILCEATMGDGGRDNFSLMFLHIQKANRKKKETTCNQNIIGCGGFSKVVSSGSSWESKTK